MPYGIASSVHAVDVDVDGGDGKVRRLILKLFLRDDPSEPDPAAREARILQVLAGLAVPVPDLVAVDPDGESCGSPALLMTRLPGRVVLRPRSLGSWIRGLAGVLARIHDLAIDPRGLDSYATYAVVPAAVPPALTSQPSAWRRALSRVAGLPPAEPPCFIHRDFHPGNVLWQGSRASGIVDWAHGCWGPPAADLGHCRWNLWYLHGREAADSLLLEYRSLVPGAPAYDRYWDLAAALGGNSLKFETDARSRLVAEEIVAAAV